MTAQNSVVTITDPHALRAIAHDIRAKVVNHLFATGEVCTGSELAHRFNITSSAMSYHLRTLEKSGYIVRSAAEDKRTQGWQAAAKSLNINGDPSSATEATFETLLEKEIIDLRDRWKDYQSGRRTRFTQGKKAEDKSVIGFSNNQLALTNEQRTQLAEEIITLAQKYGELSRENLAQDAETEDMVFFASFLPHGPSN